MKKNPSSFVENELVEKANANGGHDNITFILIENDKEKE